MSIEERLANRGATTHVIWTGMQQADMLARLACHGATLDDVDDAVPIPADGPARLHV